MICCKVEGIVLKMCFEVVFYFGEVEIRIRILRDEFVGVVEKVEIKVEEGVGYGSIVDN